MKKQVRNQIAYIVVSFIMSIGIFKIGLCQLQVDSSTSTAKDAIVYKKNSIFLEIGGNAGVYSVNYERILFEKKMISLALRFGIEYSSYLFGKFTVINPLMIEMLIANNRHNLELGGGILLVSNFDNRSREEWKKEDEKPYPVHGTPYPKLFQYMISSNIGYRYYTKNKRIFYRVNYTPVILLPYYYHWGGISIGYNF